MTTQRLRGWKYIASCEAWMDVSCPWIFDPVLQKWYRYVVQPINLNRKENWDLPRTIFTRSVTHFRPTTGLLTTECLQLASIFQRQEQTWQVEWNSQIESLIKSMAIKTETRADDPSFRFHWARPVRQHSDIYRSPCTTWVRRIRQRFDEPVSGIFFQRAYTQQSAQVLQGTTILSTQAMADPSNFGKFCLKIKPQRTKTWQTVPNFHQDYTVHNKIWIFDEPCIELEYQYLDNDSWGTFNSRLIRAVKPRNPVTSSKPCMTLHIGLPPLPAFQATTMYRNKYVRREHKAKQSIKHQQTKQRRRELKTWVQEELSCVDDENDENNW